MCDYNIIFDIYNNSSHITDDDKIKHMPQLLGHFYKYLNSLILVLNDKITKKEIINRKDSLLKNINIILNFYKYNDENKIISNFHINYLFIDLMTLAIIILYSYIHVENSLDNVSSTKLSFFNRYFKPKYSIKKIFKIKKKDAIEKDDFFRYIIIEILKNIQPNIIEDLENNNKLYDILKENIYNKYNTLYNDIKQIIEQIKPFYEIKPSEIITISQYEGICWFTAFLTCICYSDANRKIIYNKINKDISEYLLQHSEYKKFNSKYEKIKSTYKNLFDKILFIELSIVNECIHDNSIEYDILFKLFLYIIIKYISNDKKKYTEYNEIILLKINNIIKTYPIKILKILHIDYIRNISKYNHSNFNYLKNLNHTIIDDDNSYGIYTFDYNFYNYFYDILNIKTFYLIYHKNDYYIFNDINIDNIPDIFLINYTNFISNTTLHNLKIEKIEINYNNNELTFKATIYELDYILFSNDKTTIKNKNNKSNNGHVVSAITYHNDEYYHDTRYDIRVNRYNYNNPCPFIKQKWKGKKIGQFCLKKCFYTKINLDDKISNIIRNSTDDMCYNYSNGYICCYVKKTEKTSGGNNEKLKSTNKKINIIIDNKKIQRTVYINNNGIKVIKYNNKLIKIYNK